MPSELTHPHDRFFRRVWSRKDIARDFLAHYLPREVVELLDLDTLELTKGSFVDRRLRGHYSDMLYKLRLQDGDAPAFVYLLLEHKRAPERYTGLQLLRYMVEIWVRSLDREREGPRDKTPAIIPLLVYHGDRPWPYGQTLQEALDLPPSLRVYAPDFRYLLCDLSRLSETEIKGAVMLRVALLVLKHIGDERLGERLPDIFRLLRELGGKPTALGYLETLLRYLASANEHVTEYDIRRALNEAPTATEETLMATLAQKWVDQGREEGREEGIQTGEQRVLLRQLELRFGPLPEDCRKRIVEADSERLLHWSERVLSARDLDEIFGS